MNEPGPMIPVTASRAPSGAPLAISLAWLKMLARLFKLRVVCLLLVAALGGAVLGAGRWPDGGALLLLLLTGTLSAAGASAINQYLERERDGRMRRTRHRPLPAGQIGNPRGVVLAGGAMVLLAAALGWALNPPLGFFVSLGALIYVGVYTLWLKPRSALNIVIGGAAGSCAVLSGGAAAGAWAEPGVLALALLVFLWTPVHFWSLALAHRADYARAGFPMLPVRLAPRRAAGWVALHTLATGSVAIALAARPSLGWPFLIPVGAATLWLGYGAGRLLSDPSPKHALALFHLSNAYLGLVLLALILVGT